MHSWLPTFLLGLPLLCPIGSNRLCFHSHLIPGTFWFPLLFLQWPTDHGAMCSSASRCFSILFNFSFVCCLVLALLYCGHSIQGVLSIFFYLLRLPLWLKICSVLEKVPWAAENNIYFAVAGWNTLQQRIVCRHQTHLIYGVIQL
jgi:hypothetical protein